MDNILKGFFKMPPFLIFRFFSLVELLVTVAILSTLTTLAMPKLIAAVETSRQVQCASNLRQVGQAMHLLEIERNERVPVMDNVLSKGVSGNWQNLLHVQLLKKKDQAFQCPSHNLEDMFDPLTPVGGEALGYDTLKHASYIMNVIDPKKWTTPYWPKQWPAKSRTYGWKTEQGDWKMPKYHMLKQPKELIYIVDAKPLGKYKQYRLDKGSSKPAIEGTCANAMNSLNHFSTTDHGHLNDQSLSQNYRRVGYQHNGKFNALFGDLHIESLPAWSGTQVESWTVYFNP